MQPALICPSYRSDNSMKKGTTWWGKQNYKGRECDRQFIEQHQWQHKEKNHHFLHWYDSGTSSGRKLAATICEHVLSPRCLKNHFSLAKKHLSTKELRAIYTPKPDTLLLSSHTTQKQQSHWGFWFCWFWHNHANCCLISKCKYLLVIDRGWAA